MTLLGLPAPSARVPGHRAAANGVAQGGDWAWKAQLPLCTWFRRLAARRLNRNKIVVAIARELAGFVWAIGQIVKPALPRH
jgi:hypothetical protein